MADLTALPVGEKAWRPLAASNDRVSFVAESPDGRALLLGRDKGGDENTQIYRVDTASSDVTEFAVKPGSKHAFGAYSRDGKYVAFASNVRSAADFDVYVQPLFGRGDRGIAEPRRVFESSGMHTAADFSPDGKRVLVVRERSSFDQDVIQVDVAARTRTPLTPHQENESIRFEQPQFSADGKVVFVRTDKDRDFVNLAVLDVSAHKTAPPVEYVLSEEHDVEELAVAHKGTAIAVGMNIDGWTDVRLYDAKDPRHLTSLAKVDLPRGVAGHLEFTEDGRSLFVSLSRASSPNEVYRVDVATGKAERVTASNHGKVAEHFVEPTLEHFKSSDGLSIPVFLFRPADLPPGERAPVVVFVHGGPESQFDPAFSPTVQFLVARGYMVAAPNVRGSTGYGKRYAHLDDVEHREESVRDLAELNAWLRARPDVMPDRIMVTGGSYGGYMTLAAITLYPDIWSAACEIVGIANFRTFLERTASYRRALREAEYGSLKKDAELLDKVSPLFKVDRIRVPLLVVHGANDPRVPVHEAEQIVEALKKRGQKVEYLRFENEGHGVVRQENRVKTYDTMARFFDAAVTGN
jgi:dipeptidyl aminopeptidase/acylaminoacyl peptidase